MTMDALPSKGSTDWYGYAEELDTAARGAAQIADIPTAGTPTGDALRAAFVAAETPQAHGAKGDGVADDTAAINAALATQKPVLIPEGDYKISGTVRCNRNGVILTTGQVRLLVASGASLDTITFTDGSSTGMTVVFDHSRLNKGLVGPISIVGNGAANTVALTGGQSADTTVEPNNTFVRPTLSGCTWAVWGPYDTIATTPGALTGNHYIDLASSCANGVCIQQNQDDITFSGSTRLRSVTGIAVQKTAGSTTDMGNVYIGLSTGGTGVSIGNYGNALSFRNLFIEGEPSATGIIPITTNGIGTSTPRVTASLLVDRLTVNAPDGTTWIKMLGLYDHLYVRSAANLDYNGTRATSKLVELVYGNQQATFQTGIVGYDGDYDARVIARPNQPFPWQVNDASSFMLTCNGGVAGFTQGTTFYNQADVGLVTLVSLLINSATETPARQLIARRVAGKRVYLEGALEKVSTSEDAVVNALPTGYRPPSNRTFPIPGVSAGVITVRTDGVIMADPVATTGTISLDGISFQAV